MLSHTSLFRFLVLLLIGFLPLANTFFGRGIYYVLKLNYSENVSNVLHEMFIPTNILCFCILFLRLGSKQTFFPIGSRNWVFPLGTLLWLVGATLSFFSLDPDPISTAAYVASYVSPFLIYFCIVGLRFNEKFIKEVVVVISICSSIPLVLGLIAFYRTWGIPDFYTLLWARFDLAGMKDYMDMTFGNNGNTACLLVLILPPVFSLWIKCKKNSLIGIWLLAVLVLAALNLLIVQSRTAFLVCFIAFILIGIRHLTFLSYKLVTLALAVGLTYFSYGDFFGTALFLERMETAISFDRIADASVDGRVSAMREGWELFLEQPITGVGPGITLEANSATSAHQFNIQQASEIGILGLLSSVLLTGAVFSKTIRTLTHNDRESEWKFMLLIGPAMYFLYGLLANIVLSLGALNIWVGISFSLIAIVDCFDNQEVTVLAKNHKTAPFGECYR